MRQTERHEEETLETKGFARRQGSRTCEEFFRDKVRRRCQAQILPRLERFFVHYKENPTQILYRVHKTNSQKDEVGFRDLEVSRGGQAK